MNAIELLKKDHKKVAGLFKEYEAAGDGASAKKVEVFRQIKAELDVHAQIEEEIFYPAAKQAPSSATRELVLEAGEEHKEIKTLLAELADMDGSDERFDAKVTLLKEDVEHHVEEEETELFPQVKKALGDGRLEDLGRQLASRKQSLTGGEEEEREEVGAGARSARGVRRTTVPRSTSRNRSRAGSRGRPRSRSGRAGGRSGGRSRSRR